MKMNKTKYTTAKATPGPWVDKERIANALPQVEQPSADARLIEAACLLEVCKEFVQDIDMAYGAHRLADWPDLLITYGRAKAAIARAEGKKGAENDAKAND